MKYCPYCGAAILGGAVPFCAECGKPLPQSAKPQSPTRTSPPASRPRSAHNQKKSRPPQPPPKRRKPKPAPKKNPKKPPQGHRKPDPRDDGYDGYYDDIMPIDNGHTRDSMNPELVKRIVVMAAAALLVIILSVVVMYLL